MNLPASTPNTIMRRLRVAVMCDGTMLPAWQAQCIRHLLNTDAADVVVLLILVDRAPAERASPRARWFRLVRGPSALWNLYWNTVVRGGSKALHTVDMTPALCHVPVLRCRAVPQSGGGVALPDETIDEIRRSDLDVILGLSPAAVSPGVLDVARYGVWSFSHGDSAKRRGTPPCFWEMYLGDTATACSLRRLTEHAAGDVVLHQGWFKTDEVSYVENLDAALLGLTTWPERLCRRILRGVDPPLRRARPPAAVGSDGKPTNTQFVRFLWMVLRNYIHRKFCWFLRHDQWNVGLVDAPIHTFLGRNAPYGVRWFPRPARDHFRADPFGVQCGNTTTVLVEDFDYRTRKGHIAAFECQNGRIERGSAPTIERTVHTSYPYIVECDGEVYCIPEASERGNVRLYRAIRLPDQWERVATLIEGFPGVDSTVFRHQGRWWLFCTARGMIPWTRLHVWYADDLDGPWRPHSANPVKCDVRSSRPGGTPFVYDGQLYRPAQDCSYSYGAAIVLNRVLRLTPDDFEEELVAVLRPDPRGPYPHGMHTLSAVGNKTLIDGKRYVFSAAGFSYALRTQCQSAARFLGRCVGRRRRPNAGEP